MNFIINKSGYGKAYFEKNKFGLTQDQFDELEYLFVSHHANQYFNDYDTEIAILNRIFKLLKEIINENKNN